MRLRARYTLGLALLLIGCGSGGSTSGGPSGDPISASSSLSQEILVDKVWVFPITSSTYGDCAFGAKFSNAGRFGMVMVCQSGASVYRYEAAYGIYQLEGDKLILKAEPDSCSSYDTIFWNPQNTSHELTWTFAVNGTSLKLTKGSSTMNLVSVQSAGQAFPYIATRGCYVKNALGTYSWASYSQAPSAENVLSTLDTQVLSLPKTTVSGDGQGPVLSLNTCYKIALQSDGSVYFPISTDPAHQYQINGGKLYVTAYVSNVVYSMSKIYTLTNQHGDKLAVSISNTGQYFSGAVYLGPTTVRDIQRYLGQAANSSLCVDGIVMYGTQIDSGRLEGGITLYVKNYPVVNF